MDANLLRGWLGLPPGPWPPADRELLGLPPAGPLDPAAVEAAALDRMARLRTHQLLHPDLVTEGMNRVAQAMMAVGSGASARRQPPPAAPPPPPAPADDIPPLDLPPPPAPVAADDFPPLALLPLDPPTPAAGPGGGFSLAPPGPPPADPAVTLAVPVPRVLDAVPVGPPPPLLPPVAAVAPVAAFRRPPPADPIPIPRDQPPPPGLALEPGAIPPHARRAAYRELAGLRALGRALDRLRLLVALPGEGLHTPAAVCDLLEATAEFRAAAAHPGLPRGFARSLAPGLLAVLSHPLPLALFRSLTRPQRVALAREWAGGQAGLRARAGAVRDRLWTPRRKGPAARAAVAALAERPELALVAATLLVGLVAAVRTAGR